MKKENIYKKIMSRLIRRENYYGACVYMTILVLMAGIRVLGGNVADVEKAQYALKIMMGMALAMDVAAILMIFSWEIQKRKAEGMTFFLEADEKTEKGKE